MFERFTDDARRVVKMSQEEARLLDHNYIGTEHMLLGLLAVPEGTAARALGSLGVTLDATRLLVVGEVGRGKRVVAGHIPFTPRAKKTLERALRESHLMRHAHIGTEHLLLGLETIADGLGAKLLHEQGVVATVLRQSVLDLLGDETSTQRERRPQSDSRSSSTSGPARDDDMRTTRAVDKSLDAARRLAGTQPIGSHHLLLATLGDSDSAAAQALKRLGISLDAAAIALRDIDVRGTTDEMPEQAGRRMIQLRLTSDAVHVEVRDAVLMEQARATFAALDPSTRTGDVLSGDLDICVSMADVWQALLASLKDIQRQAGAGAGVVPPGTAA